MEIPKVRVRAEVFCPFCGGRMIRPKNRFKPWKGHLAGKNRTWIHMEPFDCPKCEPRVRVAIELRAQPIIWFNRSGWKSLKDLTKGQERRLKERTGGN